ncbi:TnsD family Tn7-like transposition protein [Paraburkholderia caribensis]|uniref:TnsD family Tn7-like transposition protein n=1 Tax=Paraburkholderia caribensis TaxID=75105 RepID=UPI001CAB8413|nr:TnsD family Tn7-like transposition protein [Paraburkholderia caribensis]CAG9250912.1 putative TniQ protein [Paraburkholderia caribensis]
MSVFLFPLLDDEPLAGNVSRYAETMGVPHWAGFIHGLFGYKAALSAAFPYNLDHVAEQTATCWGLGGVDIARSATLFPFFGAFGSDKQTSLMLRHILSRGAGRKPSFMMKAVRRRKTLSYCVACLQDDIAARQPLHWRRRHQLPGSLYCDTHHLRLSELPYRTSLSEPWPTPPTRGMRSSVPVAPEHSAAWQRVAAVSTRILREQQAVRAAVCRSSWRDVLEEAGYTLGGRRLTQNDVRAAFEAMFGSRTLEALGLSLAEKNNWLKARLTGAQTAMAPLADVLVSVFCAELGGKESGHGWPSCVSRFAKHGEGHPVGERMKRGDRYFARCLCGTSFSYARLDRGEPVDLEITVYGPDYRSEAASLAQSGMTVTQIATRMNLAESNVRRWLKPLVAPTRIPTSDACLSVLEDEWQVLRHRCGGVREASLRCDALYRVARARKS